MAASFECAARTNWAEQIAREKRVALSHRHFNTDDASVIAEALSKSTTLERFLLMNATIDSAAFRILAASFPRCATLQELGFFHSHLGNAGFPVLLSVLPQCEALKVLDLRTNSIGEDGAFALSRPS